MSTEAQWEMHERLIREWAVAGFCSLYRSMSDEAEFQVGQNLDNLIAHHRIEGRAEFQRLWSQYQSALAVDTFAMTKDQREQNEAEVAECFAALTRLSKEE